MTLSYLDLTEQLEAAKADAALLVRLKAAQSLVKTLEAALPEALAAYEAEQEKQAKAEQAATEAERIAALDAQFAGLSELIITEVPDATSSSVLSTRFQIGWTRPAWNSGANTTLPEPTAVWGFAALEPRVLAWIVTRHPDKIPVSVMALAPGNVEEALDRYFMGKQRGFLAS